MSCIKHLFVVFNGVLLIFGIVVISVACVDIKAFSMEASGYETDAVLIVIGVLTIIVAAFGCFGAWKESPKLLYIFAGCLIVIILLELSVGIAAAALRPQIEDTLKIQFRISFMKNKLTREEDNSYREFWDRIQSSLKCCGVTGPDNYATEIGPHLHPSHPTFSCCPLVSSDTSEEIHRSNCISSRNYYKDGCEDKVLTMVNTAGNTVIVCGIIFCLLEIAGVVLALRLSHML